jgi:hypothetical protein
MLKNNGGFRTEDRVDDARGTVDDVESRREAEIGLAGIHRRHF